MAPSPARVISPATALLDPGLHQLSHERRRQGTVDRKTNRALAGVVGFELGRVGLDGKRAGVEGAVVCPRAERHEHSSVKLERGNPVADALLDSRRRGLYGP